MLSIVNSVYDIFPSLWYKDALSLYYGARMKEATWTIISLKNVRSQVGFKNVPNQVESFMYAARYCFKNVRSQVWFFMIYIFQVQ